LIFVIVLALTFVLTVAVATVDDAVGVEWDQFRETGLPAGQQQAFKVINVYKP
jgi:hypothetical protein